MNTSSRGASFENWAFDYLLGQIVSENFGLLPECSRIFKRKGYYSKDRRSNIEFDISIEVTLPGAPEPSFIWLWECKDYDAQAVPASDLEEFESKVRQVAGLNVKGGIITTAALQRGALNFAEAHKIAVIRILPERQVAWMLYYGVDGVQPEITTDAVGAITEPEFRAKNRRDFGVSYGRGFPTVGQLCQYVLLTEIPDLRLVPGLPGWVRDPHVEID